MKKAVKTTIISLTVCLLLVAPCLAQPAKMGVGDMALAVGQDKPKEKPKERDKPKEDDRREKKPDDKKDDKGRKKPDFF